jgi:hypothetical protein
LFLREEEFMVYGLVDISIMLNTMVKFVLYKFHGIADSAKEEGKAVVNSMVGSLDWWRVDCVI